MQCRLHPTPAKLRPRRGQGRRRQQLRRHISLHTKLPSPRATASGRNRCRHPGHSRPCCSHTTAAGPKRTEGWLEAKLPRARAAASAQYLAKRPVPRRSQ